MILKVRAVVEETQSSRARNARQDQAASAVPGVLTELFEVWTALAGEALQPPWAPRPLGKGLLQC